MEDEEKKKWCNPCNGCKRWALGCELDGTIRRDCIKNKHIFFKSK